MLIQSKIIFFAIFPCEGKGQHQAFSLQFLLLVIPWKEWNEDANLLVNMLTNLLLLTRMLFTRQKVMDSEASQGMLSAG